jgi:fatty-acyl-CoA synthase
MWLYSFYTSGTTGLPKATRITHARIVEWSFWFAGMMAASQDDRLYNCLPMYHSVGGVVAVGSMLVVGGCVVVRERFSACRFWNDIVEAQCTVFQYIGELCRYLISNPVQSNECQHQLRLAVGNGLQADVWEEFQNRFGVARILEFYAATEGGISLYNCQGKPGAIGHVPSFLAQRFAVALIRCDLETGVPLHNAEGFCQLCDPDEIGEAIGKLGNGRRFDGYSDPTASEHKILRDVFVPGDQYFRTGDLMQRDRQGYYYFIDRLGDTFRWKGENVSTTEVTAVMRRCPGIVDAVVHGVPIGASKVALAWRRSSRMSLFIWRP